MIKMCSDLSYKTHINALFADPWVKQAIALHTLQKADYKKKLRLKKPEPWFRLAAVQIRRETYRYMKSFNVMPRLIEIDLFGKHLPCLNMDVQRLIAKFLENNIRQ
jgi:hypothetical protein